MTPKPKKKRRQQLRIELPKGTGPYLVKCARLMLDEPDVMHPPTKGQVIGWALRKCAAEAGEG